MEMKRILFILITLNIFVACDGNRKQQQEETAETNNNGDEPAASGNLIVPAGQPGSGTAFDILSAPVADQLTGDFPFISFPEGTRPLNKPLVRHYDEVYFPVGDTLMLINGRSYKAFVTNTTDREWSAPYFFRMADQDITGKGGVKIFDGRLRKDQVEFFQNHAQYLGEEGSIDYSKPVRSYLIRQPDSMDIFIQLYAYSAGGSIQILKQEAAH